MHSDAGLATRSCAATANTSTSTNAACYVFQRHGGKVVFIGRFIAVLRAYAAFLAGTNRMSWPRFLVFNAAGGITWACAIGLA